VIVGKTHLHPLAYGITGENPEFGDCVQPRDSGALTGGSSSGAVASVQEGSAVAAIGTDTGGSVRAPAALGGLAGYRASIGWGDWRGGAHLSVTFDTMGWLFRDLEDAPLLAAPFAAGHKQENISFGHFAFLGDKFLRDCEPEVMEGFHQVSGELQALGLEAEPIDPESGSEGGPEWWKDSIEIFAPLQASEAALLHAGHFDRCEPSIRDRLKWGASLTPAEVGSLRQRHADFRARMDELFAAHQLILMPSTPVARLAAGADHGQTRSRLLPYTAPFSLAGVPTVAIPCTHGGIQLAAARGFDEPLLALAAQIGAGRNAASEL
jgi:aspartyl-tRNA(Asn)/glutamyl-tRNA(Gln) amidotransferase subunit A